MYLTYSNRGPDFIDFWHSDPVVLAQKGKNYNKLKYIHVIMHLQIGVPHTVQLGTFTNKQTNENQCFAQFTAEQISIPSFK